MTNADGPTESDRVRAAFLDSRARRTEDPVEAVSGEIAELGPHEQPVRRTRFFLTRAELPWLPVGEAAFLLWVLAALVLIWASIGLVLQVI